ncbi:TauD/TfdA family dioxygenase [Streptomyces litchfieldiae]|uniref:TauD/TfdA family dioxygenase n=1 Tax=Streptomyces litchfieldiae TaxID=3075543 RepID=A0ABU2MYZ0_9ACTN|nr:TauD/TfdA family dioxygenase [Streptomyces sp. DSM 44938]MDT0345729.1 TauD/TfdA family dioxygenase [Streptomyces sp. DSM 44938]
MSDPAGPGLVPGRAAAGRTRDARRLLARDGAVILTGWESTADALFAAAAGALGSRLRQLFPPRLRQAADAGPVHLHADSFDLVVDVGGVPVRYRDPDEDHVLIQVLHAPDSGGASFLADAYRFVDACRTDDPELWEFLTGYDIDLYGAWAPELRGLPATPRVGRHVEYTRTGRRIVRRAEGAVPLHRDPAAAHVRAMLDRFEKAVHALQDGLPRFTLAEGEILLLDNYRCWHGRDAHAGDRAVRILTLRTTDAR